MTSTAIVNARLRKVTSPAAGGSTDSYEGPAAAAATSWEGDVGIWFDERRERRTVQGGSENYILRELSVSSDIRTAAGELLEWHEGDTVEFTRLRTGEVIVGKVQLIDQPDAPPGTPGEVRLTLELG